ncbi:AroM family protein [Propionimicrobium sp. PCR01-08-3]|uniref:AroM family protein n=1 Tax=Propionimicrobium sp. PCR01-08-3 TaxID=3052086 RepID=UPI00255CB478|nr:AroM family protein [Propionimicrobium sp. PCR01-08-3]WIY83203.1 AroM family protein [Propionimicrobium sp. PCR01-08-3]
MRLGFITIGQAPRVDMVPEMQQWLPAIDTLEYGALDDRTAEQVAAMAPNPDDEFLTTKLRDGSSVVIGREHLLPLMTRCIASAEADGADAILIVCTGEFPAFDHRRPLYTADHLLTHAVAGVTGADQVGVLSPLEEQRESSKSKFSLAHVVATAAASPYSADAEDEIAQACRELAQAGAGYIVLDCMGYTARHRDNAARASGVPVILAREGVARMAALAVSAAAAQGEREGA